MTLLPYPLLWFSLTVMWLLLNSLTPGHVLLGATVALVACWGMASLRPAKPKLKGWYRLPRFFLIVLYDIVRSNIAVVSIILFGKKRGHRSAFMTVKLDLKDPTALSLLAVVLTATPGSAWVEYESRENILLLHVLDLIDEEEWRDLIKNRYEKLLLEIFT
ncbi:Na+/H+ antiporter subunit E [Rhizobiaceae bacterium BDR2-2]|uniref:Na+/H+ antiporter subunit E n=1 Tax=Ectorhizobium quercum TaxID=2965071 RepID=A0AAE3N6P2_9HYPH|nr:Na+/H+ antiporter subunit E [Ectorhizobium quercum]MCX8999542.1 Na+/H+ antiporter subunit E [Ectorhizobium quercum]